MMIGVSLWYWFLALYSVLWLAACIADKFVLARYGRPHSEVASLSGALGAGWIGIGTFIGILRLVALLFD